MEKTKITGTELRAIMAEYAYDPDDIFDNDSQKVRIAKMALQRLSEADRILFCLCLDRGSSRAVGKLLGCSHSTVLKQIQRIKQDITYHIFNILKETNETLED